MRVGIRVRVRVRVGVRVGIRVRVSVRVRVRVVSVRVRARVGLVLRSGLARSPASTSSAVMEEPSPTVSRVLASSAGADAPAS